jgi:cytochrome c oxidase subunit 2
MGSDWLPCTRFADRAALALVVVAASGCSGVQSSLSPGGREAAWLASLFWWMAGGAALVWLATIVLAICCARLRGRYSVRLLRRVLIVGAGAIVPTVVLTVLLAYGLAMVPPLVARAPDGSLEVEVVGEQWWWRVRYLRRDGTAVDMANEIRLPLDEPVQFRLASDNVIHSFWIPSLAGKMDMIPGRVTHLSVRPTRTGTYRGVCAEYCGTSHALMAFSVEVMERSAFDRWLDEQAQPARQPGDGLARRGGELFLSNGCSACHTVRGTTARGVIGPDLTHVGSRLSLAAGILPNDREALERWIAGTGRIKPGVHMPQFGMLPTADVGALAAYLGALR